MKKLLLLACVLANTLYAQLIVSFSGGDDLSVGPGTAGYDFTIGDSSYPINSLGIWDASGSGLNTSHAVGIWDATSHLLLASVVVTPTSTVLNGFWYAPVQPLTLQPSTTYRLGAQYADVDFDLARGNATSVVTDHGTLGDAYLSSSSSFSFPEIDVAGANSGFFGPNAAFLAVPEPVDEALIVAVLLGCLVIREQWKKKLA
jgi:hypothetical protein